MNSSTWSVFIMPILALVFPVLVRYVSHVSNQWREGRKIVFNSRFDTVNEEKRQRVLNELSQMDEESIKNNILNGLKRRALYRSIGLPYSDGICNSLLNYVFHNNIPFNDPALNCFLRTPELTSVENGFQQTHRKRQKRRWSTLVPGGIMLAVIGYGYIATMPAFLSEKGMLFIMFPIGSILYLGVLLFVIQFITESLWEIEMSKKIWRQFRHYLND